MFSRESVKPCFQGLISSREAISPSFLLGPLVCGPILWGVSSISGCIDN